MRIIILLTAFVLPFHLYSQIPKAPEKKEGDGPFKQLIIRGVIMINGTGAPPTGPMDIVIENNRIVQIAGVGSGIPLKSNDRPQLREGGKEMDCTGMYLLPGLIDMHGHIGGKAQGTPAEYVFKLWMAHGITTIRDPGSGNGLDWVLDEKN
jgi:adenine deaminase